MNEGQIGYQVHEILNPEPWARTNPLTVSSALTNAKQMILQYEQLDAAS